MTLFFIHYLNNAHKSTKWHKVIHTIFVKTPNEPNVQSVSHDSFIKLKWLFVQDIYKVILKVL